MKTKIEQGETLFLEGKIDEAETVFQELLEQNPEDADIPNNLGIIYEGRGEMEGALAYYNKALEIDSTHIIALTNKANLYQKAGRWDESVIQLEKCLRLENQDPNLFNQLASAYINLNEYGKARSILLKSLELNSNQQSAKAVLQQLEFELEDAGAKPKISSYRAAFTEVNITPTVSPDTPVYLQGMAGNPRKATAVAHALTMQILLLEDENFTKLFWVSADLFGFDQQMVNAVRQALEPWGVGAEGIILNASHTHYAPGTMSQISPSVGPCYQDYAQQICQLIVQQLPKLYASLEKASLYHGSTELQIGMNRRLEKDGKFIFGPNANGFYLQHTPFLVVEFIQPQRRIVVVNHGCHPTGLGQEEAVSADFPGYMRDAIKSTGAAQGVMFFQGAAGDIKEAIEVDGNLQFCTNSEEAKLNGERLAASVIGGLQKPLQSVTGPLSGVIKRVPMPIKSPPDVRLLEQIIADKEISPLLHKWALTYLPEIKQGKFPKNIPMETQLVSLGDQLKLITFQGEPVAELADNVKSLTQHPESTFILGYSNGIVGYLPTDNMIQQGGYEVESSHLVYLEPSGFEQGAEALLTATVEQSLQEQDNKNKRDGYGFYHMAAKERRAFFVMSAGRCGTMTLAHMLDTAQNAKVWHHPQPDPIAEALQAYWGDIDKRETFWRVRAPVVNRSWSQGQIHGETDLLMTNFCDALVDEIPESKFLVLVRDPIGFVRSGMRRNYYYGHAWDFGRLKPKEGTGAFAKWNDLDQFEKVSWLWRETYARIMEISQKIPKERIMFVRFEDLIGDTGYVGKIFDFLELEGFDENKINLILAQKLNKQQTGKFPPKNEWSQELLKKIINECGSLAESFGYDLKAGQDKPRHDSEDYHTMWDFKEFAHQAYPSALQRDIFLPQGNTPIINRETKITSMGSCFARNIALHLISNKYNYLITEMPFKEASAHWDQVFSTACLRQIFEYTFRDDWNPTVRWWPKNESLVQDPFRRNILYRKATCVEDFNRHRATSLEALSSAEVIIMTLGLIETWRDKRDKATFYRVPSPSHYEAGIHEFYIQQVDDCIKDLTVIHELLQRNNPEAQLIISVSPIPLFATFRKDMDAISANVVSKATLRIAADTFVQQHQNVHYFPSFELITQVLPNPHEKDNRHVTQAAIQEVMRLFEDCFVDKQ